MIPGVVRIKCNLKKGQKLGKLVSSLSRQGYILGVGDCINEVTSAVHLAMEQVQINAKAYLN